MSPAMDLGRTGNVCQEDRGGDEQSLRISTLNCDEVPFGISVFQVPERGLEIDVQKDVQRTLR